MQRVLKMQRAKPASSKYVRLMSLRWNRYTASKIRTHDSYVKAPTLLLRCTVIDIFCLTDLTQLNLHHNGSWLSCLYFTSCVTHFTTCGSVEKPAGSFEKQIRVFGGAGSFKTITRPCEIRSTEISGMRR